MISVEIKYHTFQTMSHQRQVKSTNTDQVIYETAGELFEELWNGEPIRLLGIRTSKLIEDMAPEQISIFEYSEDMEKNNRKNEKHKKLDKALDEIRDKFGEDAIMRGTFLK